MSVEVITDFQPGILVGTRDGKVVRYYAGNYATEAQLDEVERLNGKKLKNRRRVPLRRYASKEG